MSLAYNTGKYVYLIGKKFVGKKWRKFLPTKIFVDKKFHRRVIFTDEYFLPTKISKLYYSAIILAVDRKFQGVLGRN